MICHFRYTELNCDASVNFRLFETINGSPRASVMGPVSQHFDGHNKIFQMLSSMPLADAFAAAIRMANANDTDIVVSGDRCLWQSEWGTLGVGVAAA